MGHMHEMRSRCTEVDDADERFSRLVANAFGGREARLSIPAKPLEDDDLVVGRYLREAIKDRAALVASVDDLEGRLALLRSQVEELGGEVRS